MIDNNNIIRASAQLTETGAGTAVDYNAGDTEARTFMLNCTAIEGTNPTVDAVIKECDTVGGTYATYITFDQVTAVGQYYASGRSDKRFRQVTATLGGTNTPKCTFSIQEVTGGRYNKF